MEDMTIEDYIHRELSPSEQEAAFAFVAFLREKHLTFYKDDGACWSSKIYYWVQLSGENVCFIAIKDHDEPDNHWTVWSDDMGSEWLQTEEPDDLVRELAWKHVDRCGHCGSCGGGRRKIIFGKVFEDVCGCTFRADNPDSDDVRFLEAMVEIRMREIQSLFI